MNEENSLVIEEDKRQEDSDLTESLGEGRRKKAVMWIRIHLGPWIQRYNMKGKAELNQFFLREIISR